MNTTPQRTVQIAGLIAAASVAALAWRRLSAEQHSPLSYRSAWSVLSASSILSIASAMSVLSIGSFGSMLSIGSSHSVLSIGSDGGWLSIGYSSRAHAGRKLVPIT
jgi:hypothetical protein